MVSLVKLAKNINCNHGKLKYVIVQNSSIKYVSEIQLLIKNVKILKIVYIFGQPKPK